MKAAKILLISFLIIGCGSRNKSLSKTEDKTKLEENLRFSENTYSTNNTSSVADIRNFLINNGLKIKSNGQNYELRYGDLIFSGSADLEFSEKKEETIIHHVYQINTTYITEKTYQTKTFYQTEKRAKILDVERSGITLGSIVLIVITSLFIGAIISQLIILYLKRKK